MYIYVRFAEYNEIEIEIETPREGEFPIVIMRERAAI